MRSERDDIDKFVAAVKAIRVRRCQLEPVWIDRINAVADRFRATHRLEGLTVDGRPPLVLLHATAPVPSDSPKILVHAWDGHYGAALTITIAFAKPNSENSQVHSRAYIPPGAPFLNTLRSGRFIVVLLLGEKPHSAYEVDATIAPESLDYFCNQVDNVAKYATTAQLTEQATHYWELLTHVPTWNAALTARDYLRIGWFRVYNRRCSVLASMLNDIQSAEPLVFGEDFVPPMVREYTRAVARGMTVVQWRQAVDDLLSDPKEWSGFIKDWNWVRNNAADIAKSAAFAYVWNHALHALMLAEHSPELTDCGNKLWFYSTRANRFEPIALVPHELAEAGEVGEFWWHVPVNLLKTDYGALLSGGDYPLDEKGTRDLLALPCPPEAESLSACTALIEEAYSTRDGTIPPKAVVALNVGPFVQIELTETPGHVIAVFRARNGQFVLATAEPAKQYVDVHVVPSPEDPNDGNSETDSRWAPVKASLALLLAAIVRDFWVVERRESVFATRRQSGQRRGAPRSSDEPLVVYLPRVKYHGLPDVSRCSSELGHNERRAHFVREHLRKTDKASTNQLFLAKRFGVDVPDGFTFVRPHERGRAKREVLYKSRSALQCLFPLDDSLPAGVADEWFSFERRVHALMAAIGFKVIHVAAARRGDKGIDVFATKGEDLDRINWVIQCKCWKATVYPSVVRELLGVLTMEPPGTRGMIVSTSKFSSGAQSVAAERDIRLMDGEEFLRLSSITG